MKKWIYYISGIVSPILALFSVLLLIKYTKVMNDEVMRLIISVWLLACFVVFVLYILLIFREVYSLILNKPLKEK